jgi:hypothetical protein
MVQISPRNNDRNPDINALSSESQNSRLPKPILALPVFSDVYTPSKTWRGPYAPNGARFWSAAPHRQAESPDGLTDWLRGGTRSPNHNLFTNHYQSCTPTVCTQAPDYKIAHKTVKRNATVNWNSCFGSGDTRFQSHARHSIREDDAGRNLKWRHLIVTYFSHD